MYYLYILKTKICLMSNNEICLFIFNNINIKGICFKLGIKRDFDDIQQIVYEIVLKYDNKKLNMMHGYGALLSFVYIIIRNQVSKNPNSEWKMLNCYEELKENFEMIDEGYDFNKEDRLQFIELEFKDVKRIKIEYMNEKEKTYMVNKILLKNKIKRNWTFDEMEEKLEVHRNTLYKCVKSAKTELLKKYENRSKGRFMD